MVSFAAETQAPEVSGRGSRVAINIGQKERVITGVIGGVLAGRSLVKPSLGNLVLGFAGGMLVRRALRGHCALYEKMGINTAGGAAQPSDYSEKGLHVVVSYTIQKGAAELYSFWRNFENLPRFMFHLQSVQKIDARRSRWIVRGPAGLSVKWEAEIINDEPNRLIAWRSVEHSDVHNTGSVTFTPAPGGRGTEVRVELEYIPPAGRLGQAVAWLFGEEPYQQISDDLRRFKKLMETEETPSIQGQPGGCCG